MMMGEAKEGYEKGGKGGERGRGVFDSKDKDFENHVFLNKVKIRHSSAPPKRRVVDKKNSK